MVVDPNGVGAGSSGGVVGALAPHTPENWNSKKQFQLESLLAAEGFFKSAGEEAGLPTGYLRSGRLQPLPDERALGLAHARAKSSVDLWGRNAVWEVRPRSDFGDWAPESPTGYVVYDTLAAQVHPMALCTALAQAIAAKGGQVVHQPPEFEGPCVWATGTAGLEALSSDLGKPVGRGVKGQAALFGMDQRGSAQIFAETLHFIPHYNGTIGVGSTSEREYENETSTDYLLDDLIERARRILPILADAPVVARWAGVRPRARSRAPMLGPWPKRDRHYIANGGFKIGFGMAPGVARVMADLVLEKTDRIPDAFRVSASL